METLETVISKAKSHASKLSLFRIALVALAVWLLVKALRPVLEG